ncbi:DIP1984 family protein [Amycolatopsis sp. NPDC049253]|uniref:DIP1984 family protein n=1 Tax=Amycolatopsis sp. NPDC049253 TaxID=3155274 RepID=UPI0034349337
MEALIRRINRPNAQSPFGDGTVTDALARRDVLRLRHALLTGAADAAAGRGQGVGRQLRSELRQLAALPVSELREQADRVALELRHLDIDIQRTNWEADLLH